MTPPNTLAKTSSEAQLPVDSEQVLKASKALLAHIKTASTERRSQSSKRNLLDEGDDEVPTSIAESPVTVVLATKQHIHSSNKLQPLKLSLPHPLRTDDETSICLITASPQRAYKNVVASEGFPDHLRKRITRVIDFEHLTAKFRRFEAQRQLYSQHDVFLGDDRIINRLPKALGKTFYKSTAKRPIPVVLHKPREKVNGKRVPKQKDSEDINARPAPEIAAEIEKAIGCALVNLSPSTNTTVVVGYGGWEPAQISANIKALVGVLVDKHVPKKWANVKAIYIKGSQTTALPIWQTEELWLKDADVLQEGSAELKALDAKKEKANVGRKRKAPEQQEEKKDRPAKKARVPESNDDGLNKQIEARKEKLKKQKKVAKAAMDD